MQAPWSLANQSANQSLALSLSTTIVAKQTKGPRVRECATKWAFFSHR